MTAHELKVMVPVGTTATVELPKHKITNPVITESGKPLVAGALPAAVLGMTEAGDHTTLEVGSGNYRFVVSEPEVR